MRRQWAREPQGGWAQGVFVPLSVIDRTGAPPESEGINRRDR